MSSKALSTSPSGGSAEPGDSASAALACIQAYKAKSKTSKGALTDAELKSLRDCTVQLRDARVALAAGSQSDPAPPVSPRDAFLARLAAQIDAEVASVNAAGVAGAASGKSPGQAALPTSLPTKPAAGDQPATAASLGLSGPTQSQRAHLGDWFDAVGGRLDVRWDGRSRAPRAIYGDLGPIAAGGQSDQALAEALLPRVASLCPAPNGWTYAHVDTVPGVRPGTTLSRFQRTVGGLEVLGDRIEVNVGPDVRQPSKRRAYAMTLSCRGDLDLSPGAKAAKLITTPTAAAAQGVASDAALGTALYAFHPSKPLTAGSEAKASLAVRVDEEGPRTVWRVSLSKGEASEREPGEVQIDALTGAVLRVASHKAHASSHSGTLEVSIWRPYATALAFGALPHAEVRTDNAWYGLFLGHTDATGDFTFSHNGADHMWQPRLVGPYLEDRVEDSTAAAILGFNVSLPGGPHTYGWQPMSNTYAQRRTELFALLTHARVVIKAASVGIAVDEPLEFHTPTVGPTACNGFVSGTGVSI